MSKKTLDIPFYPEWPTDKYPEGEHCAEMSLKMVLAYFQPKIDYSLKQLEAITGKRPEEATWEMSLGIWLAGNGFGIKRYSMFNYVEFEQRGIDYIRDAFGDETADWQDANSNVKAAQLQVKEYLEKVSIVEKKPTVNDIQNEMDNGYLARVMVNSKLLNGMSGYMGYSVVITGYDDDHIWFHDPGMPPLENRKVASGLFQEAMESFGSEMDVIKLG